ncbi:hypothetical protein [Streptomyces sp. NPDC015345]|uniref:hypothetical protein n=1 Tax=Streptomyces sp. NPDC015345 TaxID=3364953 RepID=UPI003701DD30
MTMDPAPNSERQIPAWASTVGPGWADLLNHLHDELSTLDPAYRIEDFSPRFGSLRITVADRFDGGEFNGEFADRAAALTDAAEFAAVQTCERAASPDDRASMGTSTTPGSSPCAKSAAPGHGYPIMRSCL